MYEWRIHVQASENNNNNRHGSYRRVRGGKGVYIIMITTKIIIIIFIVVLCTQILCEFPIPLVVVVGKRSWNGRCSAHIRMTTRCFSLPICLFYFIAVVYARAHGFSCFFNYVIVGETKLVLMS